MHACSCTTSSTTASSTQAQTREGPRKELVMASGSRHPTGGSRNTAIANMVVRVTSEYTGRGPTQARTHESGDVITVILQDMLTKGERALVAHGSSELVLATRKAFQRTMRADLNAGIPDI